ncbi:MAG: hypothetical protein HGJ94_21245 [Desulfosarcina sp.]|nr:hypothetical protein [Desulfosarcina sp.]
MDPTENYPSLINCIETGKNGLLLDLASPSGDQAGAVGTAFHMSPFSKTMHARIKTDGDDVIQPVYLVLQRDHYDTPSSLLPVDNIGVETAWQNAFTFHQNTGHAKAPIFFKHQVNTKGELKPFQPLFYCHETRRWFHPVCPQCGLALTLCRDDALLEKRGLPTYSDSLVRFLYCGSCATLSDASSFYIREKAAGMPDVVHDAGALGTQWKQLLDGLSDDNDLPCRGCPDIDVCYGPESLVSRRIVPFSFFPFFMMMFPAPSCSAADFLPMISGDTAAAQRVANVAASPSRQNRFLFQDQDRQFLEVLYLKLTFFEQAYRQLMPADGSVGIQEYDLSLEGIGVDLNPAGAGLPAYWNFNVRILDAVGTFQVSPFAPIMPEAPRLHFLGAMWFRTLLVNSRQKADAVYAEVGRWVDQSANEEGYDTLAIDTSDPVGVFAGSQIFWAPDQRSFPENWQIYWKQTLRLGFQLVHAGLRTGVLWNGGQFLAALEALRKQIKDEMFSGPVIASTGKEKPAQSEKINMVLRGILEKWRAEAETAGSQQIPESEPENPDIDETIVFTTSMEEPPLPPDAQSPPDAGFHAADIPDMPEQQPDGTDWKRDIQETVILSSADAAPPSEQTRQGVPEPPAQDPQWNNDIEETVVLRSESSTPPPAAASPDDDMDQTVVISPSSIPPDFPLPGKDPESTEEDLAATMVQNGPGPPASPPFPGSPMSSSGWHDTDLEATVILDTGSPPAPKKNAPPTDEDLAATMVQGADGRRQETPPWPGISGSPPSDRLENEADLAATVIINAASQQPPLSHSPEASAGPADDDLAATFIETPRSVNSPGAERPLTENVPPPPPAPLQPPRAALKPPSRDVPESVASDNANDDDDIMEQTVIIRSDVKKD